MVDLPIVTWQLCGCLPEGTSNSMDIIEYSMNIPLNHYKIPLNHHKSHWIPEGIAIDPWPFSFTAQARRGAATSSPTRPAGAAAWATHPWESAPRGGNVTVKGRDHGLGILSHGCLMTSTCFLGFKGFKWVFFKMCLWNLMTNNHLLMGLLVSCSIDWN